MRFIRVSSDMVRHYSGGIQIIEIERLNQSFFIEISAALTTHSISGFCKRLQSSSGQFNPNLEH